MAHPANKGTYPQKANAKQGKVFSWLDFNPDVNIGPLSD
jgi:hypothetical protein